MVQGSVLGSLIFIRFINDIVHCLTTDESNITSCCIFANDLKLYFSYESTCVYASLSITLHDIENWSSIWQLGINPDKSLLLRVGNNKHDEHNYLICNKSIAPSVSIRDLGITYNNYNFKLNFHEYIDEIVSKAFQRTNLLFRSFILWQCVIKFRTVYVISMLITKFFLFAPISSVTRDHNKKLIKSIYHSNWQPTFFSSRVVNYWNSLLPEFVNAKSISSFSNKVGSHDLSQFCRGSLA